MKRRYFFLVVSLIGLALLVPFILQAQPPDERVPPPPPYMPGEYPPGFDRKPVYPLGKPPTSTPDPFEAELLPKVTPPVLPTLEVIDTAPEVPHEKKYQILIKRGKSGKRIFIAVPFGVDKEVILKKHLILEDGDEFVHMTWPMARPPGPTRPQSK